MGYEIVGAVYDGYGNALSQEDYESMIAAEALQAAGLDVGAFNFAALRPSTPAARQQSGSSTMLRNLLGGNTGLRNNLMRMAPSITGRANTPQWTEYLARDAQLRQTQPGPIDETPLPIDSGAAIAAGGTAVIAVNSQIIFRPRRLIVPPSLAPFFVIDDIRVGNVPLYAGVGGVPAEAFAPDSVNPNVKKVTANPGVAISLTVTNIDGFAHRLRAVFFGEGSQPEGCR